MTNLTTFTVNDILFLRSQDDYHEMRAFKRNLIVELKENYKLKYSEITELLKDKYTNIQRIYENAI